MSSDLIAAVEGGVGRLRLNRPKAIHALSHAMCDTMIEALLDWRNTKSVVAVMIDHAEGRGFCAGGDIRMLAESAASDGVAARTFYYREYQLNHLLFTYNKPIMAIADGITMGGGVGISQPASIRVVTERTMFAMPETGIGLFPDVGGGWYLSRLPGQAGRYLAVTGARINGADCMSLGIGTHYIPSHRLEALKAGVIADPASLRELLRRQAQEPPEARMDGVRDAMDRLFVGKTLEDIFSNLEADGSDWALEQARLMRTKSPQTMKVALRQLERSVALSDFAENMRMEYGLACRIIRRPDFVEGVRAVIVDKDNAPRWDPPTPEAATDELINSIFEPLPPDEAWSPLGV